LFDQHTHVQFNSYFSYLLIFFKLDAIQFLYIVIAFGFKPYFSFEVQNSLSTVAHKWLF